MEAAGLGRTGDGQPSRHPASTTTGNGGGLDYASGDELTHSRGRNTNMTADADKPDTPLGDEATREPLSRAEQLRDLGDT
jgi:hypothetical protein